MLCLQTSETQTKEAKLRSTQQDFVRNINKMPRNLAKPDETK